MGEQDKKDLLNEFLSISNRICFSKVPKWKIKEDITNLFEKYNPDLDTCYELQELSIIPVLFEVVCECI
jgi:hypothetical protein